jgi:cathepsin B
MTKTVVRIEDVDVRKATIVDLPKEYDAAAKYPFIQRPRNQGSCGSCWAISTTDCLRDRLNLFRHQHNLPTDVPELSFQLVADCAMTCITYKGRKGCARSCNGGFLVTGFRYLESRGTTRDAFHPNRYDNMDGMKHVDMVHTGTTHHFCPAIPATEPVYRCQSFYITNLYDTFGITNARSNDIRMGSDQLAKNVLNIQREIYERGPVAVCFNMYSDFRPFWKHARQKDLVYEIGWQRTYVERSTMDPVGKTSWSSASNLTHNVIFKTGHSVSIVGWGEQMDSETGNMVPYWICRNSWGNPTTTYNDGFFKVRRGINTAAIESDVAGCWFTQSAELLVPPKAIDPALFQDNTGPKVACNRTFIVVGLVLFLIALLTLRYYETTPKILPFKWPV